MSVKKKKNKKKKLGSLILLLFLTVIMLATSTYAWFTANRTVKITNIDVNVAASSGLQISTDASNWKTIISKTDITTGYNVGNGTTNSTDTNHIPTQMVPVSTTGSVTSGKLNMYKGTVAADTTTGVLKLTAEKSANETKGATGDYIAFDIFLKLDKAGDVYLEKGSGVTGLNPADVTKGLQYASRYAFVVEGNMASTSSQYDLVSQNGGTTSTIYEPNYDGHTAYGVTQAASYYTKYTNYSAIAANETGNPQVSYDGIFAAISTGIELPKTNATDNNTYFAKVTPTATNTNFSKGTADANVLFKNLSAGVTKIRVYFWIEGQDVDCENNASGSDLLFNLSFTLNDK